MLCEYFFLLLAKKEYLKRKRKRQSHKGMFRLGFEVGKICASNSRCKDNALRKEWLDLDSSQLGVRWQTNLCSTRRVSNHRRINLAQIIHSQNQAAQFESAVIRGPPDRQTLDATSSFYDSIPSEKKAC